ncbi:DUF2164 family protein [Macrococcus sp. DPC7161]|uniref:DUF2164 family protein n=1 Tax=Macrococcus sp. DPC7161 TaxID=2507060 RepID=UPI00100B2D0F|nr:DUF2164 family protein [Macrococcus sp. DPC7161]RXK17658.1 hypothetical protein ER639_08955 [Macrococcus sp. DPC7161]
MKIELALKLKKFLMDTYEIEIGEIASKNIIDYLYPSFEDAICDDMKDSIYNNCINDIIHVILKEKVENVQ